MGLISWAQLPELTIEQHLEDYDFAVKYIEDNYSGFSFWVVDSTRADYEATKARLRSEVERGKRSGWDAVAAYICQWRASSDPRYRSHSSTDACDSH